MTVVRFRRYFCAKLLLPLLPLLSQLALSSANAESLLIRPLHAYESLIKGVHDYFNNTCVILFHDSMHSVENGGLEEMDGLLTLQRYLSGSLSIRTAIMDFRTFETQLGDTYHRIKRPLFVLLNDLDEIKRQFVLVSKWITMAYPTWLLFLRDGTKIEEFLFNIYVPFDCVLMVTQRDADGTGEIVRDVYRIDREDDLRVMNFGWWNASSGFHGPRLGLYQRRHDLQGRNIRVVSVHDPPISRIIRDEAGQTFGLGGFFGEVVQLLQEGMNCTLTYSEAASWGVRQSNGRWSGLMRMLVEGEADFAAAELMMTSERLDAVRFTTPIYSTKCRVYIRRPETTAVKWNAYLAPFAFNVWNAIALTIVIVGVTIVGVDGFSSRFDPFPLDSRLSLSKLLDIAFFVFGAFCGQGMEPSTLDPIRLVHLSVHLTAVVVLAAYSAALISYLAIKTFAMPFTTMEGLVADGTYRFGVISESAYYHFFQNTTDTVLSVMFDKLLTRETDLPRNYFDGLTRICSEKKYAFMTLDNIVSVLHGKVGCALEPLDAMMQTTIAMAVPSESPYRGIIDSNILLLRDSGILQRLQKMESSSNAYRVSDRVSISRRTSRRVPSVTIGAYRVSGDIGLGLGRAGRRAAVTRIPAVGFPRHLSGVAGGTIGRSTSGAATGGKLGVRIENERWATVCLDRVYAKINKGPCLREQASSGRRSERASQSASKQTRGSRTRFPFADRGTTNRGRSDEETMAHSARKPRFAVSSISFRDTSPLSGKENARSSVCNAVDGGKKVSLANGDAARRTRVFLGSNDERRREAAGSSNENAHAGRTLGSSFPAKKTPFHVHCDQRNVVSGKEEGSRRDAIRASAELSCGNDDNRKQAKSREGSSKAPLKRSAIGNRCTVEESRLAEKFPPSKIPCRPRSNSVQLTRDDTRGIRGRSASVDVAVDSRVQRRLGATASITERSVGTKRTAMRTTRSDVQRSRNATDKKRNARVTAVPKRTEEALRTRGRIKLARTPVDEPPPPRTPLKAVIRRNKEVKLKETDPSMCRREWKEMEDTFPRELSCHEEYHEDLPAIEREREERSPRLSANFLTNGVNVDQRRLVVAFLLRLGMHCRYPSYIVYQSVKLFDAVTDRIPVETAYIQLSALASLWICLKRQENFHKIPTATTMVALAKDLYTDREDLLIAYEREILQVFDYNVSFADAYSMFAHHVVSCGRRVDIPVETGSFIYNCGNYVIDVTLLDERFCRASVTLVVLTVVELVFGLVFDAVAENASPRWLFWRGLLFAAVPRLIDRFPDKEIDETRIAMLRRLLHSGKNHCGFEMVYKKYSRSKYGRISESFLKLVLRLSAMETIFDS